MGFSRQEYQSGLPFSIPGDLPDPEIEPGSFASPELAGVVFYHCTTWQVVLFIYLLLSECKNIERQGVGRNGECHEEQEE